MNNLGILKKNRDVLLLAEAIGWLHDYRKCTDEHLKAQSQDLCKKVKPFPSNVLSKIYSDLSSINLHICINNIQCKSSLLELLNKRYQGLLGQYLRRCHNTSHFDKQEPTNGKQKYMCTSISTPFGFEKKVGQCLTSKLLRLPWRNLIQYNAEKRKKLRKELEELFLQGLGDTRRPVNEVDLWSWGLLVGSLYKAALAGSLLRDQHVDSEKLQWRLLCIRFDGPGFFLKALRIPDLLARQELLKKGLDSVRELLEVEYPLGSEVYRDENGNVFVVPDLANLLELTDENDNSMRDLILEKFQSEVEGEIQPHVELETEPWWGQDPEYRVKRSNGIPLVDKLPDIANFLIKSMLYNLILIQCLSIGITTFQISALCAVCDHKDQMLKPQSVRFVRFVKKDVLGAQKNGLLNFSMNLVMNLIM